MKKYTKSMAVYFVIIMVIIAALWAGGKVIQPTVNTPFTYGDLIAKIATNEIETIELQGDSENSNAAIAAVTLKGEDKVTKIVPVLSISVFTEEVTKAKIDNGADFKFTTVAAPKTNWIISLIFPFIMTIGFVFILFMLLQQMQGGGGGNRVMSFGKSKAKMMTDDKKKVTFAQVAGLDEEKAELEEVVEFLKLPKKFIEIGARIPKGILLVGPPGTGKTLLAKAVAGEAGVPFFSISGSDFVEMFVGVGASRVRDLFEQAKKNSPCIIFIDEIDAVGRRRGAGMGGGHDEREQTLNQLLVEMDGFGSNEGIILIAATNRPDILDPALLRPGRFDRQVVVGRPDVKGREEILVIHSKGKLMAEDVDLKVVAQTTAGFTGADLENLLNEAALLSARDNKKEIDMTEVRRAFIKVGVGTEKKSRVISDKERSITAYHETGHAILQEHMSELDPVHMISVIPTGLAGGFTMHLPQEDRMFNSKTRMKQEIVSLLGGRVAEEIIFNEMTTGASNDIERATAIARAMVTKYGMSKELGPIQFGAENDEVFIGRDLAHARNYSEDIANKIDEEIKNIIETAYNEAEKILNDKMELLHKTANVLVAKEKITGDEFRTLYNGGDIDISEFKPKNELL